MVKALTGCAGAFTELEGALLPQRGALPLPLSLCLKLAYAQCTWHCAVGRLWMMRVAYDIGQWHCLPACLFAVGASLKHEVN